MKQETDLAEKLFGNKRLETGSEKLTTTTIIAKALTDSENGYVEVEYDGNITYGDFQQNIVPTGPNVKAGDTVLITATGGVGKTMSVTNVQGWGDRLDKGVLEVSTLIADKADIDYLEAEYAHITEGVIDNAKIDYADVNHLEANYAHITDGVIDNAKIGYADVEELDANFAHITDGVIDNAEIGYADVKDLDANFAHITEGVIDNAKIGYADVEELDANYAHLTNGVIDNATIGHANVNGLNANYAHITNGAIDNAKIGYADVNGLNANYAHITNGTIDNAKIGYANVNDLEAHYAQIDFENVTNSWVENGVIRNGAIQNEMVQNVSASKLTAGTIDASKINVANLSADNLIVRRINGQPVVGGYTLIGTTSPGYSSKNPSQEGWYELSNGAFVLTQDTSVQEGKPYYQEGDEVALYDQAYIDNLKNQLNQRIDGAVETFTGTAVPTLTNYPYNTWYDTSLTPPKDERASHVGDIYFVVNPASDQDGYSYRFAYDNTSMSYMWVLIKDSDVTKALSDITDLQDFESETVSWKEETDEGLTVIRQNHTALSGVVQANDQNLLLDWNAPSLTNVDAAFPRYWSDAGNTMVTCSFVELSNPPKPGIRYAARLACDGSQTSSKGRGLAFYNDSTTTTSIAISYGQIYTVSVWARCTSGSGTHVRIHTTFKDSEDKRILYNPDDETTELGPEWKKFTFTFTPLGLYGTYTYHRIWFYAWFPPNVSGTIELCGFRAEAGVSAESVRDTFVDFEQNTFKELVDEVDEQSSTITQMSKKVETIANPNLSPFLSREMTADDKYNATTNPEGFWNSVAAASGGRLTKLSDGWAHIEYDNTQGSDVGYITVYPQKNWQQANRPLVEGGTYTALIEVRDVTRTGEPYVSVVSSSTSSPKGMFASGVGGSTLGKFSIIEGELRGTTTARSDFSDCATTTRTLITIPAGASISADIRLSLYEGDYEGPYKPYANYDEVKTISNTVNSVKQTADANTASISGLTTVVSNNGLTETTNITSRASKIEQTLDGFSSTVGAIVDESVVGTNILTGDALNPYNWTISAPTGASYTKTAYGTAGVKVQFSAISGWEWLYSPAITVESGKKYTLSVEYTVGKDYTIVSGKGGYGLSVYKTTPPHSSYDNANANFIARAQFFETETRVAMKATVTFTASSNTVYLGLNGGQINDSQPGLEFTMDKLTLVENISSRMSSAETSITQNAGAISLNAKKAEQSTNMLADFNAPSLTAVNAKNNRYFSDNSSYRTGEVITISDPPEPWIVTGGRISTTGATHTTNTQAKSGLVHYGYDGDYVTMTEGESYTFSFWARKVSGTCAYYCQVGSSPYIRKNESNYYQESNDLGTGWTYIEFPFTYTSATCGGNGVGCRVYPGIVFKAGTAGVGEVCGAKVTRGSYASQAELKVANDAISARVEKNGVIASINASVETSGGSAVTINADKVNIAGATIFTTGRLSSDNLNNTYDSKGSAEAVQTNLDNLEIGGRNLVLSSGSLSRWAKCGRTYGTITIDGPMATMAASGNTANRYLGLRWWVNAPISELGEVVVSFDVMSPDWSAVAEPSTYTGLAAFGIQFNSTDNDIGSDGAGIVSKAYTMRRLNHAATWKSVPTATNWEWLHFESKPFTFDASFLGSDSSKGIGTNITVYPMLRCNGTVSIRNFKLEKGNKATDWSTAPEDANVRYDGVNLAKNSADIPRYVQNNVTSIVGGKADPDGGNGAYLVTPSASSWYLSVRADDCLLTDLEPVYTASVWLRADNATTCRLCVRYMDNALYSSTATRVTFNVGTTWKRYSVSGALLQAQTSDCFWIGQLTTEPIYVYHPKIEKGDKPTDWIPAPEDFASASDAVEYIVGTQTAATGSWTGVTKDKTLEAGKTIAYKLPYAGSGNASLQLKDAAGNNVGNNVAVYTNTTRVTTHFGAGAVINMTYDGSYWRTNSIPNTNNYDRRLHNNYIKAAGNVTSGALVCGTASGYKQIAASVTFDLSYPILWAGAAWTSGTQYANAYEAYPSVNIATTLEVANIPGIAANKTVYVKGTVSGNTFTCASANFLTCTPASSADGNFYIPVGILANDYSSTATNKLYFSSSKNLYAYIDGKFRQVNPTDIVATQKVYYRSKVSGTVPAPTTWITLDTDKYNATISVGNGGWSIKKTAIAASTAENATKYLYLYTCEQRKRLDGTVDCGKVTLDDATTVIDGGTIITHTVTAEQLNATSINASNMLTVGSMTTTTQSNILNSNIKIGAANLLRDTALMSSWGKNNNTTITDGVVTFPTVTSATWREIWPGKNFQYEHIRNKTVTFSCEVRAASGQASKINFCIGLDTTETAYARQKYRNQQVSFTGTGDWQTISVTSDITDSWFNTGSGTVDYADCWVTVRPGAWNDSLSSFQARHFQLEVANIPSAWQPAAEDVLQGIIDAQASADAVDGKAVTFRGVCSTAAATADKVIACSGFELVQGNSITVYNAAANTSAAKIRLNVNGKGLKDVWVASAVTSDTNRLLWTAGTAITFTYSGSVFVVADSAPSLYGTTCGIAEGTAAKTTSAGYPVIMRGTTITVPMTYANTAASPTLNVSSLGAANIYYGTSTNAPTAANGFSWIADTEAMFTYDGKFWRMSGKTYINGGHILTNTIGADKIKVGEINVGALGGSIGGTNLILYSNDQKLWGTYAPTAYLIASKVLLSENLVKGEKYTITIWGTQPTRSDKSSCWYAVYWGGGSIGLVNVTIGSDGKGSMSFTAPNSSNSNASNAWLCIYNTPSAGETGTTYGASITKMKLERGDRATDWSASPEDEIARRRAVYATCSTAAGTAAKAAACDKYQRYTGSMVTVTFSAANTATTPTLNVNSTGAATIKGYTGAALTEAEYKWAAGATISFTFDGTYWRMQDGGALQAKADAASSASTATSKATAASNSATAAANSATAASGSASTASDKATAASNSATAAAGSASAASSSASTASSKATAASNSATAAANSATAAANSASTASDKATAASNSATAAANSATEAANRDTAFFGTCGTAAGTQAKVVACTNFKSTNLKTGTTIVVRCSTAQTYVSAKITLNVNSTGAKDVYAGDAVTSATNQVLWAANAMVTFVYNGSQWVIESDPRNWFGACTTAAGTQAKAGTLNMAGAVICKGTTVALQMSNANTHASPTLNVGSTAAKNLYIPGATTFPTVANGNSWFAGATVNFVFDGQYWRLQIPDSAKFATALTSNGVMVHKQTDTTTGVQITDQVDIIKSGNSVATFAADKIQLGKNSATSVIEMCNAKGTITTTTTSGQTYFDIASVSGYDMRLFNSTANKRSLIHMYERSYSNGTYGNVEITTTSNSGDGARIGIYAKNGDLSSDFGYIILQPTTPGHIYGDGSLSMGLAPVSLYDNESAAFSGSIKLAETAANFTRLEVYCKDNDGRYCYSQVWNPNGKTFNVTQTLSYGGNFYVKSRAFGITNQIIDTVATSGTYHSGEVNAAGNNTANATDVIKIVKVLGYR